MAVSTKTEKTQKRSLPKFSWHFEMVPPFNTKWSFTIVIVLGFFSCWGGKKVYPILPDLFQEINGLWVFPKIGVPQNGWFIMEIPIKMDDLGVPLFQKHPCDKSCE